MSFDERYGVIQSRDPRFDGQFVTAVQLHRDLLPAQLPGPHAEAVERLVLRHQRGRARSGLPRLQALPSRSRTRFARVGSARRHDRARDATDRRRGRRARRACRGWRAGSDTRRGTSPGCSPPSSAPVRSRSAAPTARTPPGCCSSAPTSRPPMSPSRPGSPASASSTRRCARCSGCRRSSSRARRRRGPGADAPGAIDLVLPHRGPFDADGLFAWMGARADQRRRVRLRHLVRAHAAARRAARRGSRCASTRSVACACVRASRISATCRRSSRARVGCSTWMPTRSPSTTRSRGIPNSPRSSPGCPASAYPAPPTRTRCSSARWSGSRSRWPRRGPR